jgi:hypothetical protein
MILRSLLLCLLLATECFGKRALYQSSDPAAGKSQRATSQRVPANPSCSSAKSPGQLVNLLDAASETGVAVCYTGEWCAILLVWRAARCSSPRSVHLLLRNADVMLRRYSHKGKNWTTLCSVIWTADRNWTYVSYIARCTGRGASSTQSRCMRPSRSRGTTFKQSRIVTNVLAIQYTGIPLIFSLGVRQQEGLVPLRSTNPDREPQPAECLSNCCFRNTWRRDFQGALALEN